jgi:hypothetical protein
MGQTDPARTAIPAENISFETAPINMHAGNASATGPRHPGETVEGSANWESAWIDLGGEG